MEDFTHPPRFATVGLNEPSSRRIDQIVSPQHDLQSGTPLPRVAALRYLFFSPLALLLPGLLLDGATPDLAIDRPAVWPALVPIVFAVWLALKLVVARRIRIASSISWAGTAAMIGFALWRVASGTSAHHEAHVGPVLRAQAFHIARDDSGFIFADGTELYSNANFSSHYGSNGRCVELRLVGPTRGFRWVRIVDAAPLPGAGGLAWPTDPADCFSAKPLVELGK